MVNLGARGMPAPVGCAQAVARRREVFERAWLRLERAARILLTEMPAILGMLPSRQSLPARGAPFCLRTRIGPARRCVRLRDNLLTE
jgi:hypothetical protein